MKHSYEFIRLCLVSIGTALGQTSSNEARIGEGGPNPRTCASELEHLVTPAVRAEGLPSGRRRRCVYRSRGTVHLACIDQARWDDCASFDRQAAGGKPDDYSANRKHHYIAGKIPGPSCGQGDAGEQWNPPGADWQSSRTLESSPVTEAESEIAGWLPVSR